MAMAMSRRVGGASGLDLLMSLGSRVSSVVLYAELMEEGVLELVRAGKSKSEASPRGIGDMVGL